MRINVDLATDDMADAQDMLENVVDYHVIEKRIRAIIAEGHVRLAETLAERIAAACFEDRPRPHRAGAGGKAGGPDRRRERRDRNRAHPLIYYRLMSSP